MNLEVLRDYVDKAKSECPCSKYSGALTTELLRSALKREHIKVSRRDVFIRGIPIEFDLLVVKNRCRARDGILYDPDDVLAVLEVKNRGAFGPTTEHRVRQCFDAVRERNGRVYCAYVCLAEQQGYKSAVTTETLGTDAFTFFEYRRSGGIDTYLPRDSWADFVSRLREHGAGE